MIIGDVRIVDNKDVSYLDNILLQDGLFQPIAAKYLKSISQENLSQWCVKNAFYQIATIELIDWLKNEIGNSFAIEIGAGQSGIGHALGIKSTDSYMQTLPEIKAYYQLMGQPTIEYPEYVEKLNAVEAIKKYKPEVVIGSFITQVYQPGDEENKIGSNVYGIDEYFLLANVKKYIHIGNEETHKHKRIFTLEHKKYNFDWLYSRSFNRDKNAIWVWEQNK